MTAHGGESETGVLRCFGQQLRLLRTSRGLTRAELGAQLGYGEDMIASVELGRRIPRPEFIERADAVLGADGLLAVMKDEVARARYPAFFRDAAKLETEAVELHVYANHAVPGLLQAEEYARAVFEARRPLLDETVISERVAARLARQKVFDRKPLPTISFVIEESVLRRPIGGWGVWRGQLEQICLRGRSRNVEIQIMPTEVSEHAALAGPFTLIETVKGQRIAYVEVQKESRLLHERSSVREHEEQYGILRAQALTPRESLQLVEKLLGER
ncbi:helix-turn-helix domain-containing protein [Streptomyces cynarae]|uniref:Helix-turn-helix domain-containing protein n=1 Tax=Streptomyces cynarae TaxID=2981134 RepID=A0ABY6EAZ8_9ACTN|nr:helix-turn-helix transcriptional regulator [Streptomyces cynarae]UXY23048.1 helix-turn-helix domain-containing protein [Streptomyces cynarae]